MREIRTWQPEDRATLAAMEAACFDAPWSEAMLAPLLNEGNHLVLGFFEDEVPLAYGIFSLVLDEAECERIGTLPTARRQGLAQTLFERAMALLRARGAVRLFLEVHEDNLSARALYEALGMNPIAVRPHYYADGGSAWIYRKEGL